MMVLKISDISADLILTLTELITTVAPNYYFVFTHVLTNDTVAFTKTNNQDLSSFKQRYNKFNINPSSVFASKPTGEWHYKVYENNAVGVLLEQGKMILEESTPFDFSKYDSQTSFKTYNG